MRRKFNTPLNLAIICLIAFICSYGSGFNLFAANNSEPNGNYEIATVERVVDGDTLVANVDGQNEKIRLIGVNTPESAGKYADNPQPGGVEASKFTKSVLTQGATIYLTTDTSDTDKYGRLLRYVWTDTPDESQIETKMFNAILLTQGYADTMSIAPDVKYADLFETLDN